MSKKSRGDETPRLQRREEPVPESLPEKRSDEEPQNEMLVHFSARISSPYPPPKLLEQYDRVIPGFAAKIIDKIDDETNHRREMERASFQEATSDRRDAHMLACRGPIFALAVTVTGFAVTSLAVIYNRQWIGSIVGGGTLLDLVIAFLKRPALAAGHDDDQEHDR